MASTASMRAEAQKMMDEAAKKAVKSLAEAGKPVEVAEIRYHEGAIMLPNGMSIDSAMEHLERRREFENTKVAMHETIDVFLWDGARALDAAMTKMFGWSAATKTPGFFGDQPPHLISVNTGPHSKMMVPWGRMTMPGVDGWVSTDVSMKGKRFVFALTAEVKRKDEATIKNLFKLVREEAAANSLYKGKAIKMRFLDDDGDAIGMPEPEFLDTERVDENQCIYPGHVQQSIETNLFTPIRRVNDLIANDIPIKRGVLLAGPYGTGKTLAAHVASKLAVEHGITYLYVPRADELPHAIEFAKQYQSPACVIFCEDIDRATSGERTIKMDDILNLIDGIDTKSANIIVVLTTNHLESINPAMLRPGRLDAVISVEPPDAAAVEKLLRMYGGSAVDADADLAPASKVLAGLIPATIAEVVKRAKLSQLSLIEPGTKVTSLSGEAFEDAAMTMRAQIDLLNQRSAEKIEKPALETAFKRVLKDMGMVEQVG